MAAAAAAEVRAAIDHRDPCVSAAVLCARRCAAATLRCSFGARRARLSADLQKLVDTGRGDSPLIHLKYRCKCGSRLTDWVVTSRYGGRPAWNRDGSA